MKMWILQSLLIVFCTPLSCVTGGVLVGYEGKEVNVSCPYGAGYETHEKYLCRNYCHHDGDVVIKTTEVKKGKYSIHDDRKKRNFTVTISHLTLKDAGKYSCWVTKFGRDPHTADVKLDVEWCCVSSKNLNGTVGRPVTMQCPYPIQHRDNRKFLCKGELRNNCRDMVTSQSRFTLQDDVSSNSFSVIITELKAGDAGTYWCGSDSQWSAANYIKIHLSAVFPQQTSTVTPVTSQSTHIPDNHIKEESSMNMLVVIVPAVLPILVVALLVVYRCKVKGAEVNTNRNISKTEAREMKAVTTKYEKKGVACSDMSSSKRQNELHHNNTEEDQQESVYQNFTMTDSIYCNL